MRHAFNSTHGLILVATRIDGPSGQTYTRLALDTGATCTLIRPAILVALGYDPAAVGQRVQVTTGSGLEYVPRLAVDRLEALGHVRRLFDVLAHTLPPSATVDGLLGLDFLRGLRLSVDFRTGGITLT